MGKAPLSQTLVLTEDGSVVTLSIAVDIPSLIVTPTPTPSTQLLIDISRDLAIDADEHANPPHFRLALPTLPTTLTWRNAVATFTASTNDAFTAAYSLPVTFTDATFEAEFFGIARQVDIDLSALLDNAAAGQFRMKCSIAIPKVDGTGNVIVDSAIYSCVLNSPAATINVNDADAVTEGNSGTTTVTFPVNSIGAQDYEKKVDWMVQPIGSDPVSASDFPGGVFPSGTLTIPAGLTTASLAIPVKGDADVEPDESLMVVLSNVRTTGYAGMADVPGNVGATNAQGFILNDDVSTYTTNDRWSQSDGTSVAIQNNGLTAQGYSDSGQTHTRRSVRGTIGKSSGKWFSEITINQLSDVIAFGMLPAGFNQYQNHIPGFGGGEGFAAGYDSDGKIYFNGNPFPAAGRPFVAGDRICQAVDRDSHRFYLSLNDTWVVGDPRLTNGNPTAAGLDISSLAGVELFTEVMVGSTNDQGDRATLTTVTAPPPGYSYL